MINRKDKIQQQALQAWIKNKCRGTVVMATGSGKTRVGVLAANMYSKVLIVTPTTNLRDKEWNIEINKWGNGSPEYTIECVQTVYNAPEVYQNYDLVILDEVHTMLSPEYSKVFNIESPALLCLTATVPSNEEYKAKLESLAPIVYTLTLEEAVQQDLISDYKIYNVPIPLTRGERYLYSKFNSQFLISKFNLMKEAKGMSLLDFANSKEAKNSTAANWSKKYLTAIMMRKNICYKSKNKIFSALEVLQKACPSSKWIVFSTSIHPITHLKELLDANGISNVIYHSKMGNKEREEQLSKAGEVKVILSAMALNAGFNLPSLDGAICLSGTSSSLTFIQQIGRLLRKTDEDKIGTFINFYAKSTVEEDWLKAKLSDRESLNLTFTNLIKNVTC